MIYDLGIFKRDLFETFGILSDTIELVTDEAGQNK